jgi:hypothetical protein
LAAGLGVQPGEQANERAQATSERASFAEKSIFESREQSKTATKRVADHPPLYDETVAT